jgi:hypothetical protein
VLVISGNQRPSEVFHQVWRGQAAGERCPNVLDGCGYGGKHYLHLAAERDIAPGSRPILNGELLAPTGPLKFNRRSGTRSRRTGARGDRLRGVVTGTYVLAQRLHMSGPLAVVAAGL